MLEVGEGGKAYRSGKPINVVGVSPNKYIWAANCRVRHPTYTDNVNLFFLVTNN